MSSNIAMEYIVQYILKKREYARIASIFTHKVHKDVQASPPHAAEVRQLVRLFLKLWIAAFALKKATGKVISPTKFSTTLVSCSLTYRLFLRYFQHNSNLSSPALASIPSGAIAGFVLAYGLPSDVSGHFGIYLATKVCEWGYNILDDKEKLEWKPKVLGTWLLFPFAFAQLFQSMFTNPETCPSAFKKLLTTLSNGALKAKAYENDVIQGIAEASITHFPEFRSPLVYKSSVTVEKLIMRAHPGNTSVIGALLHPHTDNRLEFFSSTVSANLVLFAKYLLPIYLLREYMGNKSYSEAVKTTARIAIMYSMTAATSLIGIQFSQKLLGRKLSPKIRFSLIGFLSGLWAILNQRDGRAQFLYVTRMAIYTLIPLRSRNKVTQVLLPISMALAFNILNTHPEAMSQNIWCKLGNWIQYGEWNLDRHLDGAGK